MIKRIAVATTFALALGVAGAAGRNDEASPEGRAYLGFTFGGERAAPRDFHYGLRLDHDSRFLEGQAAPPLMHVDFTRRGLNDARVNGLSVLKQQYRLRQNEGEAPEGESAEPVEEEEGFFEGMWNGVTGFFGGLFGGDDEETETAGAEPAEAAEEAPEELAEGTFMGYNAVDWALLAVGAVGIGFVGSEVANSDEDPDATEEDNGTTTSSPTLPTGVTTPVAPYTPFPSSGVSSDFRERIEWLDGGTGQMGDLEPRED